MEQSQKGDSQTSQRLELDKITGEHDLTAVLYTKGLHVLVLYFVLMQSKKQIPKKTP